jgi:hypothetical protein
MPPSATKSGCPRGRRCQTGSPPAGARLRRCAGPRRPEVHPGSAADGARNAASAARDVRVPRGPARRRGLPPHCREVAARPAPLPALPGPACLSASSRRAPLVGAAPMSPLRWGSTRPPSWVSPSARPSAARGSEEGGEQGSLLRPRPRRRLWAAKRAVLHGGEARDRSISAIVEHKQHSVASQRTIRAALGVESLGRRRARTSPC